MNDGTLCPNQKTQSFQKALIFKGQNNPLLESLGRERWQFLICTGYRETCKSCSPPFHAQFVCMWWGGGHMHGGTLLLHTQLGPIILSGWVGFFHNSSVMGISIALQKWMKYQIMTDLKIHCNNNVLMESRKKRAWFWAPANFFLSLNFFFFLLFNWSEDHHQ